jgi:hypothetical protein
MSLNQQGSLSQKRPVPGMDLPVLGSDNGKTNTKTPGQPDAQGWTLVQSRKKPEFVRGRGRGGRGFWGGARVGVPVGAKGGAKGVRVVPGARGAQGAPAAPAAQARNKRRGPLKIGYAVQHGPLEGASGGQKVPQAPGGPIVSTAGRGPSSVKDEVPSLPAALTAPTGHGAPLDCGRGAPVASAAPAAPTSHGAPSYRRHGGYTARRRRPNYRRGNLPSITAPPTAPAVPEPLPRPLPYLGPLPYKVLRVVASPKQTDDSTKTDTQ